MKNTPLCRIEAQFCCLTGGFKDKQAYSDLPSGAGAGPPKPMGNPGGFQMQTSAPSNGNPSFAGATRTSAVPTPLYIKYLSTHLRESYLAAFPDLLSPRPGTSLRVLEHNWLAVVQKTGLLGFAGSQMSQQGFMGGQAPQGMAGNPQISQVAPLSPPPPLLLT
jgi:hypothetical protein